MDTPKVAVDFDNTIATHNPHMNIFQTGSPIDGSREFLKMLNLLGHEVWIFSARASDDVGINVIKDWLIQHKMDHLISGITNIKRPDFVAFVDDRAISFNGDYGEVLRCLQEGR